MPFGLQNALFFLGGGGFCVGVAHFCSRYFFERACCNILGCRGCFCFVFNFFPYHIVPFGLQKYFFVFFGGGGILCWSCTILQQAFLWRACCNILGYIGCFVLFCFLFCSFYYKKKRDRLVAAVWLFTVWTKALPNNNESLVRANKPSLYHSPLSIHSYPITRFPVAKMLGNPGLTRRLTAPCAKESVYLQ